MIFLCFCHNLCPGLPFFNQILLYFKLEEAGRNGLATGIDVRYMHEGRHGLSSPAEGEVGEEIGG